MLEVRPGFRRRYSRDLHVRFSARLFESVERFAEESGLALNGSVRLLVERGLSVDGHLPLTGQELTEQLRVLANTSLAGLMAAEHTHLLVASSLPAGMARSATVFDQAATAAHERLLRLETALEEEAGS